MFNVTRSKVGSKTNNSVYAPGEFVFPDIIVEERAQSLPS